jgi:hypothetical protein
VYSAAVLAGDRLQVIQITPVVLLGNKARLAIVAALDNVLGDSRQREAGSSGHGSPPCEWQCSRLSTTKDI